MLVQFQKLLRYSWYELRSRMINLPTNSILLGFEISLEQQDQRSFSKLLCTVKIRVIHI